MTTTDEREYNRLYQEGKLDGQTDCRAATDPEPRNRPVQDGLNDRDYAYLLGYVAGWNETVEAKEMAEQGGC